MFDWRHFIARSYNFHGLKLTWKKINVLRKGNKIKWIEILFFSLLPCLCCTKPNKHLLRSSNSIITFITMRSKNVKIWVFILFLIWKFLLYFFPYSCILRSYNSLWNQWKTVSKYVESWIESHIKDFTLFWFWLRGNTRFMTLVSHVVLAS